MARGKQKGVASLKDSVPESEIVISNEVVNEPNFILADGEYGITGKYRDYSLVQRKEAHRTGTEEDGINNGKIIRYTRWEDVSCYNQTLTGCFEAYSRINTLTEFKTKKLMSTISELYEIEKSTNELINKTLAGFDTALTKSQAENLNMRDAIEEMKLELIEAKKTINDIRKAKEHIDIMEQQIKEKSVYIINRDKPKQHRTPKEEE